MHLGVFDPCKIGTLMFSPYLILISKKKIHSILVTPQFKFV